MLYRTSMKSCGDVRAMFELDVEMTGWHALGWVSMNKWRSYWERVIDYDTKSSFVLYVLERLCAMFLWKLVECFWW